MSAKRNAAVAGLIVSIVVLIFEVQKQLRILNVDFWEYLKLVIPDSLLRPIVITLCAIVAVMSVALYGAAKEPPSQPTSPAEPNAGPNSPANTKRVGRPCSLALLGLMECPLQPDAVFTPPENLVKTVARELAKQEKPAEKSKPPHKPSNEEQSEKVRKLLKKRLEKEGEKKSAKQKKKANQNMKRMCALFLLVFVVTVPLVRGQEYRTISGFVKDAVFQVPMGGVTVSAGSAVTQTDMAGHFSLTVQAGIYSVKAEVPGFESTTIMVDVTTSDIEITLFMEKETEPEPPAFTGYDVEFELQTIYLPARVSVQFLYTENFSVTNVRTLGNSLWTAQVSPVGIEFNAKDVDTFDFDVVLMYRDVVEQVIQIGIWSGTLAPNSIPIRFVKSAIYLHFKLVCTEQPRPPTADEVALEVLLLTRQELEYYMDQITLLTRQFEQNLLTQWVIIGATISFGIAAVVVAAYALKTKRELIRE